MGTLVINGRSEREVCCDTAEIRIELECKRNTVSQALEDMFYQGEILLKKLEELGFDLSDVHIVDDSIEHHEKDGATVATASREIKLRVAFDMSFINTLLNTIRIQNMDIQYTTWYFLSNKKELHETLLAEAIADSRKKAEKIVSATGQRVVGIDHMEYRPNSNKSTIREFERKIYRITETVSYMDRLCAPTTIESEEIDVRWLVE